MGTISARARTNRVLVIDDHRDIVAVIKHTLHGVGYPVMTASDGVEGLRVLMECKGDVSLVIVDLYMPKLGGAHFAELIRIAWPALPIVIISAYPEAAREVIDRLSLPVLKKPFSMESLLTLVGEQLA